MPVRIASELGRKEFVLVALVAGERGPIAFPIPKGSGAVTSFSQADGFLEIDALASGLDAGSNARVTLIGQAAEMPDLVIMGSHCVALDVVLGALAEQRIGARTLAVGSMGGVAAAQRGECDLAPVHLLDSDRHRLQHPSAAPRPRSGERLAAHAGHRVSRTATRASKAARRVRPSQAALADPACLMVNRNAGAGTRILIDQLLQGARPPGYSNQPRSHNAVAAAVAQRRRRLGRRHRDGGRALWARFPAARAGGL